MGHGTRLCAFALAAIALISLEGCGGGGGSAAGLPNPPITVLPTPAIHNEWAWVGGSNLINQTGTYGTLGSAAAANAPGGRYGGASWTDGSGNFWLFGGIAAPSPTTDNYFNDLWKYSGGQWTWVGGSNGYNQTGVYGTQGTAAPSNIPGARVSAASWMDSSGNLWLFGGTGLDSTGRSEILDDLWKYSDGQWTSMGGPKVGLQNIPGVYGTQGTAAAANLPGARYSAVNWTDKAGAFWLFGGIGYDSAGSLGYLSDLWKYSAGQWAWMSGSNLVNQPGNYGTRGTAAAGNAPGPRVSAAGWVDAAGDLWLFGGSSGLSGPFSAMNDMWKYSGGQWTWMAGSNRVNQSGIYGTQGTAAANNTPGARAEAITWTDAAGSLWLFGGDGWDAGQGVSELNDLWKYSGGQWTWVGGPNVSGQPAKYGNQGTPASGNLPGGRVSAMVWSDSSGNVFLLGGLGYDSAGAFGYLNDLWKYVP